MDYLIVHISFIIFFNNVLFGLFSCLHAPPFFLNQLIVWIISFPHLFNFCCCFYLHLIGLFACSHVLYFFLLSLSLLDWIISLSAFVKKSFCLSAVVFVFLSTPCLDYLLFFFFFFFFFFTDTFGLFACLHVFYDLFLQTACLDSLLVHMSVTLFFLNTNSLFRLFASLRAFYCLFLPTFCLDYLLFHVSFSVFFTNTLLGLLPCSHVLYYNYCLPRPCLPSSYCIVLV